MTANVARVGVVRKANYINSMLSVCPEGQTDGTNPSHVICKPKGIADNTNIKTDEVYESWTSKDSD